MGDFRDLRAWQEARTLVLTSAPLIEKLPVHERYLLADRWRREGQPYFSFSPYVPKEPRRFLPLRTFHCVCPSPSGQVRDERPGCVVKLEAVLRAAPARELRSGAVLPFVSTGPHAVLPLRYLVVAKIIALAVGETGINAGNEVALIKHIYDVFALQEQLSLRTVQELRDLRPALDEMLQLELSLARPRPQLRDVVTAVGIFLPTMELAAWRQEARGFGANFLQRTLTEDEWSLRWRLVRYFAMALGGRADDVEFIQTRRRLPLLAFDKLGAETRRQLVRRFAEEIVRYDIPPTHAYRTERPDVLFCEMAYRGQMTSALRICNDIIGTGWDAAATSQGSVTDPTR